MNLHLNDYNIIIIIKENFDFCLYLESDKMVQVNINGIVFGN